VSVQVSVRLSIPPQETEYQSVRSGGEGRNRTDECSFCRAVPYHLATPPLQSDPINERMARPASRVFLGCPTHVAGGPSRDAVGTSAGVMASLASIGHPRRPATDHGPTDKREPALCPPRLRGQKQALLDDTEQLRGGVDGQRCRESVEDPGHCSPSTGTQGGA
jgi:hypothetical protein